MKIHWLLLVAAACLMLKNCGVVAMIDDEGAAENDSVNVSPKCAAVLLVGAGSFGVIATNAVVPLVLGTLGFGVAGVAGGSVASWWQSTMPLIAKGSLFATLQSIAMGGTTVPVAVGAIMGGAVGTAYLQQLCSYVDETDPNSAEGRLFEMSLALVTKTREGQENMKHFCESSPTCSAVVATSVETVSALWKSLKHGYNEAKMHYEQAEKQHEQAKEKTN